MRDVVEGDDLVIAAGRGQPGLDLGQVGRHQAIGWNRDDHDPRRPEVGGALQRRRPRDRGAAVHRPAGVGRDDDTSLGVMIDLAMKRAGVSGRQTAKELGKGFSSGRRTPHRMGRYR